MEGIVIGSDQNQEWMLPWWWRHYTAHNSYPVQFVDFGLSKQALAWCKERGECVQLQPFEPFTSKESDASTQKKEQWEARYGKAIWARRSVWFKKPLAVQQSPFPFSIWLDLDCKVKGSLEPLFNSLGFGIDIAVKREPEAIQKLHKEQGFLQNEINYNSGVIVFRKGAEIVEQWALEAVERNEQFVGDQQALSRAIYLHRPSLFELPDIYNWCPNDGENPHSVIDHFHGGILKLEILRELGVSDPSELVF